MVTLDIEQALALYERLTDAGEDAKRILPADNEDAIEAFVHAQRYVPNPREADWTSKEDRGKDNDYSAED